MATGVNFLLATNGDFPLGHEQCDSLQLVIGTGRTARRSAAAAGAAEGTHGLRLRHTMVRRCRVRRCRVRHRSHRRVRPRAVC